MDKQQSKSNLLEASILPTWLNQRSMGVLGYGWIWVGMVIAIAQFSIGASVDAGLSLSQLILIVLLANVLIGLVMTLTADIGIEHGLSFAVYLRATFGTIGTHLPSIARGLVAAAWFGIQTYLGALALNGIGSYLTGFDSWITWYIIFAIVQIMNTAMGIRAVQFFISIAAPTILVISIWMYFTLDNLATESGKDIWTFVGDKESVVLTLFLANVAWWSALAVDIPNLTRFVKTTGNEKSFFKRNKNIFIPQLIALPVGQAWMALVGGASFIATGDWNPITVIQDQEEGIILIVLLVMITLVQWSTNAAANLIPAALTFVNAGAPKISYRMGILLAGIVGTLCMPWLILDHLYTYLNLYGALLSSLAGIMICDYYIIRRRRLNVPDLYTHKGQFFYSFGFNPAGFIAWAIGGGVALFFLQYAYLIGFPTGLIVYLILMKTFVLQKYPQQEVIDPDDEKFLATSVNKNWVYAADTGMQRLLTSEIPEDAVTREDL